jgi:CheY-like chemotaxis protein
LTRSANAKSKRVLVVDDDSDWREYLRTNLEELGYEALEAENGRDALETLSHDDCSVVLLDLRMPGMSGEEMLAHLPRGGPRIVLVTSANTDEVREALSGGPHYYLPKGATREALSLLMDSLVH